MSRAADLAALIVDVNTTEAKTDELTGKTSAGSIAVTGEGGSTTTNLQQGLAKAWAAFQQSGTHTMRDSFNMSSISDIGTGQSRFVFVNSMSNADYATTGCSGEQTGGGNRIMGIKGNSAVPATTGFDIANFALSTGSAADDTRLSISVLGDLA